MNAIPTQADDAALLRAYSERGDRKAMNVLFARPAIAPVAPNTSRRGLDSE